MSESRRNSFDRREFLKEAALTAALGVGGLSSRSLMRVLQRPAHSGDVLRGGTSAIMDRDFRMVVIGDSLMWGQGMDESSKFTTQVQQWLQQQLRRSDGTTGRRVAKYVFAHSGATIAPAGSGTGDIGDDKGFVNWDGEYPRSRMSITYQVGWAKRDLEQQGIKPEEVDLVLMDGGINDVDVRTIISPLPVAASFDPTISGSGRVWFIRKQTKALVGGGMRALLPSVLSTFPNAKVCVCGYFPIITKGSAQSAIVGLLDFFSFPLSAFTSVSALVDQSAEWAYTSNESLREAVNGANSAVGAVALAGSVQSLYGAGGQRGGVPQPSGGPPSTYVPPPAATPACVAKSRVTFADVAAAFANEHGYGCAGTFLWRIGEQDDARPHRLFICDQLHRAGDPRCEDASMGHPNHDGVRVYSNAIVGAIACYVSDWNAGTYPGATGGGASPVLAPLTARMAPDTVVSGQESEVIVYAIDSRTKKPVDGTVQIGGKAFRTNTQFSYTFKCFSRALPTGRVLRVCDVVRVSAPGYAGTSIRYTVDGEAFDPEP